MLTSLIESTITGLASQFIDGRNNVGKTLTLPTPEGRDPWFMHGLIGEYGILIPLEITCDNHGYDKKGKPHKNWETVDSRRYLTFIILSSRKVFVSVTDKYGFGIPAPETFENTSNHDTCWRSDGMRPVFKAYMEVYDDCWKHIDAKFAPAPIAANHYARFNDIKFVKVAHEALEQGNDYHRKLTKIEEVKYNLTLDNAPVPVLE